MTQPQDALGFAEGVRAMPQATFDSIIQTYTIRMNDPGQEDPDFYRDLIVKFQAARSAQ